MIVMVLSITAGDPSAGLGQMQDRSPRSDGLQISDFAAPEDMKQLEARNLKALLDKWTEKYCAQIYSGCAAPAQEAYDDLLNGLPAVSTMPQMNSWRQKMGCVDRCMMDFAPPAPEQDRGGCIARCASTGKGF